MKFLRHIKPTACPLRVKNTYALYLGVIAIHLPRKHTHTGGAEIIGFPYGCGNMEYIIKNKLTLSLLLFDRYQAI